MAPHPSKFNPRKRKTFGNAPASGGHDTDSGTGGGKSIKNQIRSITRFLRKEGLADDVRAKQQERLDELQKKLEAKESSDRERHITLKYRKIRFVDRRKLIRKISQAERTLSKAQDGSEKEQSQKNLDKLKEDMLYVQYFPKGQKYVSVFSPREETAKTIRREALRKIALDLAKKAAEEIKEGKAATIETLDHLGGDDDDDVEEEHAQESQKKKKQKQSNLHGKLLDITGKSGKKSATGTSETEKKPKTIASGEDSEADDFFL